MELGLAVIGKIGHDQACTLRRSRMEVGTLVVG